MIPDADKQLIDVTRASMAVCAARLDATVSAGMFAELVEDLVAKSVTCGSRLSAALNAALDEPDAAADGDAEPDVDDDYDDPPPLAPCGKRESAAPQRRRGPPPKLSYTDRVRIRQRYDEALEGRQRAPNGFLDALAIEYDVAVTTIKDVIYRRDGT